VDFAGGVVAWRAMVTWAMTRWAGRELIDSMDFGPHNRSRVWQSALPMAGRRGTAQRTEAWAEFG